jgi:hypothetical protein
MSETYPVPPEILAFARRAPGAGFDEAKLVLSKRPSSEGRWLLIALLGTAAQIETSDPERADQLIDLAMSLAPKLGAESEREVEALERKARGTVKFTGSEATRRAPAVPAVKSSSLQVKDLLSAASATKASAQPQKTMTQGGGWSNRL